MNLLHLTIRDSDSSNQTRVLRLICTQCRVYNLIVSKRCSEILPPHPFLVQIGISLAEVRCVRIINDHQPALILHISSIARNYHQCFEKFVREPISFWMEDLSGHTRQSFYLRRKGIGEMTNGWRLAGKYKRVACR